MKSNYFDYTYINQRGSEVTDTFATLIEALRMAARDHESRVRIPLNIKNDNVNYDNQDILMMCQKYNLF